MILTLLVVACSNQGTVAPPGDDLSRFDPIAHYAEVAAFAGEGSQLLSFDANGVRSDGTVDLSSDLLFSVHYQFVREVPAPPDAPPVGAGGSPDGRYQERVDVRLSRPGLRTQTVNGNRHDYRFLGMEKSTSVSPGAPSGGIPAPACSLATLWAGLAAAGAPAGAVAFASYENDGWDLWVQDTPARVQYGADCGPVVAPGVVAAPVAEEPMEPFPTPAETPP